MIDSLMFSVIIPAYNKELYIKESVESVLAQTFHGFELVIIDDASTDKTLEIVKGFNDKRIKIYSRNKPGSGGYAARNLGVKRASNDWIAFLDADDTWRDDHLETVFKIIQKYDCDIVTTAGIKVDNEGRKYFKGHRYDGLISRSELLCVLAEKDLFLTNSIVLKKSSFLDADGFRENVSKRGSDYDLWLRLALTERFYVSSEQTAIYNYYASGVVKQKSNLNGFHPVVQTVKEVLKKCSLDVYEQKMLKRFVNRKSIQWLISKKKHGVSIDLREEKKGFFMDSISLYQYFMITSVLLPNRVFDLLWSIHRQKKNLHY